MNINERLLTFILTVLFCFLILCAILGALSYIVNQEHKEECNFFEEQGYETKLTKEFIYLNCYVNINDVWLFSYDIDKTYIVLNQGR